VAELLSTLGPYFRPYRRGFFWGIVMVVLANVFTIAGPYLLKLAIDSLGDPDVTPGRIAGFAGLIVLAAVLGGAARYGMRELLNGISRRIEADLRNDFFIHLMSLDAAFYGEERTGDLMSRATNDTLAVRMAAGPAIMYSVNTVVGFVFALALMLYISPRLTGMAMVPMLVLPPAVLRFGKAIHRRFEDIQEQFSTVSTMVQENLTGVRIVRAYGQESSQAEDFDRLNQDYLDRNMRLARVQGLFHPVLSIFTGMAVIVVLWMGGLEVMAGRISVGDFVAFGFYLNLLIWPMIALGWVVNLFQRGAASMGRINRILDRVPTISAPSHPLEPEAIRGLLEFRGVWFRYPGTERYVLRNVSFVAHPGETVAVVGPTGSGKSTLVSLIPRLYDPERGEILLDGHPLPQLDPRRMRRAMGVVPQDSFLFSDTIGRNIALGRDDETMRRAAKTAQLAESIQDFPRGYDTPLGERGINLSGGQKQRATLARALARDPVVLILDDALSAVDTHTEARILEDLREVMKDRTSFIISHRVSAVMNADQILVLDDGEVVERGTHAELMALGGTYAALLRRQLMEEDLEEAGSER
jgi:ATP-binding cassette subfamily B multidrug efflux pump